VARSGEDGPFDRAARRRARDRAATLIAGRDQILRHAAGELEARAALLGPVPEGPELRLGLLVPPPAGAIAADPGFALARAHGGVQMDEDRLPFADGSFARILSVMTLHGVNDLPGALVLARRALRTGGRFLAVFPAGFTLGRLRDAFLQADAASARGVPPRLGPTVGPAQGAALLQRAGFHDPVAEVETLTIRTTSLATLALDLRCHGDTGWLAPRPRGLMAPVRWAAAEAAFLDAGAGERPSVEIQLLYLSGKAPAASASSQGRTRSA
jgi:SAM-dependent methyltransferase